MERKKLDINIEVTDGHETIFKRSLSCPSSSSSLFGNIALFYVLLVFSISIIITILLLLPALVLYVIFSAFGIILDKIKFFLSVYLGKRRPIDRE